MSGYTNGPWVKDSYDWITSANGDAIVEYAGCGSHEAYWPNPANISLVLAAPELLEALELAVSEYEKLPHSLGYEFTHLPAMRAAIAKAKGEQKSGQIIGHSNAVLALLGCEEES